MTIFILFFLVLPIEYQFLTVGYFGIIKKFFQFSLQNNKFHNEGEIKSNFHRISNLVNTNLKFLEIFLLQYFYLFTTSIYIFNNIISFFFFITFFSLFSFFYFFFSQFLLSGRLIGRVGPERLVPKIEKKQISQNSHHFFFLLQPAFLIQQFPLQCEMTIT